MDGSGFVVWLRELITRRGLTGEDVAQKIGVSGGHVSNLLLGKRRPGYKVISGLWEAFPEERDALVKIWFDEGAG
jgi:transcriptional regulator with XRE-family HTH domain